MYPVRYWYDDESIIVPKFRSIFIIDLGCRCTMTIKETRKIGLNQIRSLTVVLRGGAHLYGFTDYSEQLVKMLWNLCKMTQKFDSVC